MTIDNEAAFTIHWQLFVRAASPKAVDVVLRRFAKAIGRPLLASQHERYWKDPALYRVSATTPLEAADVPTAVFEALRLGQRVGGGWSIHALSEYDAGRWSFRIAAGGRTSRTSLPGIELVAAEARNYAGEMFVGQEDDTIPPGT